MQCGVGVLPWRGDLVCQPGLPYRERAGFVKSHCLHAVRHFERLRVLDQNALLGRHPSACHDGHGRGQAQRTWACNDQHRHGVDQSRFKLRPLQHPNAQGGQRHQQHHWHKDFGHFVDQALNRRFGGLGIFDQSDDVRKHRFMAHRGHAHHHAPIAIDRAPSEL